MADAKPVRKARKRMRQLQVKKSRTRGISTVGHRHGTTETRVHLALSVRQDSRIVEDTRYDSNRVRQK